MLGKIKHFIEDWKEFKKYKKDIIDKRRKKEELFEAIKYTLEDKYKLGRLKRLSFNINTNRDTLEEARFYLKYKSK